MHARFQEAIAAFDTLNAADPVTERVDAGARPRLLLQAERLNTWVRKLDPNASEALQLAAHCQHLERWKVARGEYPEGRIGYLQWRTRLGRFHAERSRAVLASLGYTEGVILAVEAIVTKQHLRSNPDAQTMEDALCLVFLEHELGDFMAKHPDEDKIIAIVQKTWRKMSERGRAAAVGLRLSPAAQVLVGRAIGPIA
jgi:hypothetical protein